MDENIKIPYNRWAWIENNKIRSTNQRKPCWRNKSSTDVLLSDFWWGFERWQKYWGRKPTIQLFPLLHTTCMYLLFVLTVISGVSFSWGPFLWPSMKDFRIIRGTGGPRTTQKIIWTPIFIFNEILLSKPDTRGRGSENRPSKTYKWPLSSIEPLTLFLCVFLLLFFCSLFFLYFNFTEYVQSIV